MAICYFTGGDDTFSEIDMVPPMVGDRISCCGKSGVWVVKAIDWKYEPDKNIMYAIVRLAEVATFVEKGDG